MNKTIITSIAAVAFLTACSAQTSGVSSETTKTTEYVAPSTMPVSPQQNFLEGLSYDYPAEVSYLGKAKVIELGGLTCEAIDEGSTLADFAQMAINLDIDAGFLGALIRESVENFCPDNQWFIDSAMNA